MSSDSALSVEEAVRVLQPVAADVMCSSIPTCSTFSTVVEAVLIFKDEGRGVVPVVEEGKIQGIVTARDVALVVANYANLSAQPVSEIMTKEVVQIPHNTPLEQVVGAFLLDGVRHVLVVDDAGEYLGVIGWTDLAPYLTYQPNPAPKPAPVS